MTTARTSAPNVPADAFRQFSDRLHRDGLRAALSYLLHLTDYRFIAIFRTRAGMATAAAFVDRENPGETRTAEVPDSATYCCYVQRDRSAFTTADTAADPRLRDHPPGVPVRAYAGVPVMDREGTVLGTLCHYDLVPRDPAQVDLGLMLEVASALVYGGHVPAYPEPLAP
jgi:GAF domain-containing protein